MSSVAIATPSELLKGGRIKGSVFKAHLQWLRETRSSADHRELLDRLPPAVIEEISSPVMASEWYSFATVIAFDQAVLDLFGDGNPQLLEELGAYSARSNIGKLYAGVRAFSAHEFFRQSALLHRHYQDFGSATYEQAGALSGRMLHRYYRCFSPIYCASARGYYAEALRLHGADSVRVQETSCHCYGDDRCTFELSWLERPE